jgi:hypothetical protein
MRLALLAGLAASIFSTGVVTASAEDKLQVELNAMESVPNRCRTSFMVRNGAEQPVETFKLDLVILNSEQVMHRRMIVDLGPIRAAKAMMRTFDIEGDCKNIGGMLVNDIAACVPAAGDCMERLTLSSRVPSVQLFK